MLKYSIQRCSIVALGEPNLAGRECSPVVGMESVWRKYLGDVLVDDIGEHGVHGSKVV